MTRTFISFVLVRYCSDSGYIILIIISLALDPNWKLAYIKEKWDHKFFDAGVTQLELTVRYHDIHGLEAY